MCCSFYYFNIALSMIQYFSWLGGFFIKNKLLKYVGDKIFYQRTFRIALPLALQNLLSSCMGIIDTMMVTRIGKVTAVGTAVQIDVLHNLISYGISSGISMFAAQFYGSKQSNQLKRTFGLGLILSLINALFWVGLAFFFKREILAFYMSNEDILKYSIMYLEISMFAMIPFAINNNFQAMYRSTHQANITLFVSTIGALSNILLNAIFIFGFMFIPAMGIRGAALGTLLAQSIVCVVYIFHSIKTNQPFIGKVHEVFDLNWGFVSPIVKKMSPLVINEAFFGLGSTLFVKAYGLLGTQSMDAYYVANQIYNCFAFVVYGYGSAISILIGTRLGEGRTQLAKEELNYHIGLSLAIATSLVLIMVVFAEGMVSLFGISDLVVYKLATSIVNVFSIQIFMRLFSFMIFSTLRAGGDSKVIQFLDSGIMYAVGLPIAFGSVYLLKIENIAFVLLLVQVEQFIRMVFGLKRLHQGVWAKDLTKLVKQ